MNAVLHGLACLFAVMALLTSASVVVPIPTRVVCFVAAVVAGVYGFAAVPVGWVLLIGLAVVVFLVLQAVIERPDWNRAAASLVVRSQGPRRRTVVAARSVLMVVLLRRRAWAEGLAGVALQAMANSCESCERAEAWCRVEYPDGKSFRVCGMCAAAARVAGAVRSFS